MFRAGLLLCTAFAASASGAAVPLTIIKSQYLRLALDADLHRVAVGDPNIVTTEPITNRELLVLGGNTGRTTLIVWFRNGTLQEYLCTVQRDLTVLREALRRVHAAIDVEMAPDRDALVLTGTVPDITYSQAAETVARNYLEAGESRMTGAQQGAGRIMIQGPPGGTPPATPAQPQAAGAQQQEQLRVPALLPPSGTVINLLRLEKLPPLAEDKVRDAIRDIGGGSVTVRRILRGPIRDDAKDVLLLEGTVPNQVALVRILSVASQILTGQTAAEEDIRVVADEAGALTARTQATQQQGGQFVSSFSGGGGVFGSGGGGGGGRSSRNLTNQIRRNLGRAKVVEAAGGRILSFLTVADLPQVRVNIRLYEVDRTKLRNYNPNSVWAVGDFRQPSLNPAAGARAMQGDQAARVGGRTAIQDVLSFLGGTLANQLQVTAGRFAIDSAFSLLERSGIARSLSSPSVNVLSGELALVQVGGEIPVPEAFIPTFGGSTTGGAGTTITAGISSGIFSSVTLLPFGVELNVRPLVGDDDTITLDVLPQVATPNADLTASIRQATGTNLLTTAFQTRALRTSARLQDGQALLIGGLVTRNKSDHRSSTPGLSDVAGLGWLFKSFERTDDGFELVVVVNPVIIREPVPELPMWQFPDARELTKDVNRGEAVGANKALSTHSGNAIPN